MVHTERCTEMVAEFEGFRPHVYQDANGVWTIGYGHTQGVHQSTPPCTKAQALIWLDIDLHKADDTIAHLVKVPLTQNQYDGLASFVFNIGWGHFQGSSVLMLLNQHQYTAAAGHFMNWVQPGSANEQGLRNRRVKEMEMFNG